MEEKLYFKSNSHDKNQQNRPSMNDYRLRNLALFISILIIASGAVIWLFRGKTTTSGEYPSPVITQSLLCRKANAQYPKITGADSENKKIEITMIFNGTTSLRKISLDYTLFYNTAAEIKKANITARNRFGVDLGNTNFPVTVFDNKFSSYEDRLVISMYGTENDISDELRASYFMVNLKEQASIPKSLNDYKEVYESQGFNCTTDIDDHEENN